MKPYIQKVKIEETELVLNLPYNFKIPAIGEKILLKGKNECDLVTGINGNRIYINGERKSINRIFSRDRRVIESITGTSQKHMQIFA